MLTDQPANIPLAQFIDTLSDAAVYLQAIRDEQHRLTDLLIAHGNEKGDALVAQGVFQATLGEPLLGDDPLRRSLLQPIFRQYAAVLLTGETQEFDFLNPVLHRLVHVTRSRLGDGILVVVRDPVDQPYYKAGEPALADLLSGILEASLNGIITYEATRNQQGRVVDFRFIRLNQAALRMLNLTVEVVGKPMLNQLPGVREAGLFDRFVRVVETGESDRFETPFPAGDQVAWYDMAVVKLGDGLVITFNDITAAKLATLRDQQERTQLDSIINASLNGILACRAVRDGDHIVDFTLLRYNAEAARIFGFTEDMTGRRLLDQFSGVKDAGLFDRYVHVTETGEAQRLQTEYRADGLDGWFDIGVAKFDDGFVITFNDITASKRAAVETERQAEETERQRTLLDGILNASPNAIWVFRAIRNSDGAITDFRYTHANRVTTDVFGYSSDVLLNATYLTLYPNAREAGTFEPFCAVTETGKPYHEEFYHGDHEGPDVWYDITAVKLGDGVVVTAKDISDQKRTALQTEQQANFLNNVLEASPNGIVVERAIRDEAGTIVDFLIVSANHQAASIVETTVEELVGYRDLELHPHLRESGFFDAYVRTIETGEPQTGELYYNDGRLDAWIHVATRKLNDDELVITFSDVSAVKRAQQALEQAANDNKQQADLLHSVLNGSINGIMLFESVRDEAGTIVDFTFRSVNEASCRMINRSADELIGQRQLTLYPGNRESGLFDLYVRTTETGEPGRTEVYYNHDGLDFWLDISAKKMGDGFVVTFTDVSVVKRAQHAVEQSAAHLQNVINLSQTAIFLLRPVFDKAGAITDFVYDALNQTLADYVAQTPETMIGTPVSRWFPTYKTEGYNFGRYRDVFRTGQSQRFEIHYGADGIDSWLDVSVARIDQQVLVTFSDYTPLKLLQQQLENSAAELQTVIDTAPTGIFLFSPVRDASGAVVDFRFRLANRQLASYVGQEPAAVVGALGSTWFPDYHSNGLFERYRHTYQTGEQQRFDFHYDGSGIDVWLDIIATKMGDEVVVTFGDYTSLKKLQEQLQASVVDLQRSNRNLEQFAYVASHDLQEPLRKIQQFGDIIQNQYAPQLGEQGADIVQRMQSAAGRMQGLIKDVLAYSRVATRRESSTPVDLNQVLSDVLDNLETAIAAKGGLVEVVPLPIIVGDAPQLRQLFQNLLSNALKFSKPDQPPHLRVTCRRVPGYEAGPPVSGADEARSFCQIEVTDNGIGFEPHHAERIFQVFQRLHGRSQYEGTGIGLAIVQKVVENHHGYIVAEGRPGEGATFRILLPA